jgi:hypothetical protein
MLGIGFISLLCVGHPRRSKFVTGTKAADIRGVALQSLYRLVWRVFAVEAMLHRYKALQQFFRSLCRNHSILVTDVVVTFAGDRRAVVYSGLVDLVSAGTTRFGTLGTVFQCFRHRIIHVAEPPGLECIFALPRPQLLLTIWNR